MKASIVSIVQVTPAKAKEKRVPLKERNSFLLDISNIGKSKEFMMKGKS